jgi:hypothetical protein
VQILFCPVKTFPPNDPTFPNRPKAKDNDAIVLTKAHALDSAEQAFATGSAYQTRMK